MILSTSSEHVLQEGDAFVSNEKLRLVCLDGEDGDDEVEVVGNAVWVITWVIMTSLRPASLGASGARLQRLMAFARKRMLSSSRKNFFWSVRTVSVRTVLMRVREAPCR